MYSPVLVCDRSNSVQPNLKKHKTLNPYLMKVESAAGLEGLGEELAVDAVLVSSTSIIIHTDNDGSMRTLEINRVLC